MEGRGTGFPLELECWWLPVAQSGCWKLNLGPGLEQDTLLLLSHLFRHCCLTILTHFLRVFTSKPLYVKLITNYVGIHSNLRYYCYCCSISVEIWLFSWWQHSFERTFSTAELIGVSLLSVLEFCLIHYSILLEAYNMNSFLYILMILIFKGDYDRTFARRW